MIKKLLFILFFCNISIGFSQENAIDNLSVAPNPFTNSTIISFSSTTNATIFFSVKNVLGKTVYRKEILVAKGENTLPFFKNDLPTGVYIYSIQDQYKTISKRFVIR